VLTQALLMSLQAVYTTHRLKKTRTNKLPQMQIEKANQTMVKRRKVLMQQDLRFRRDQALDRTHSQRYDLYKSRGVNKLCMTKPILNNIA